MKMSPATKMMVMSDRYKKSAQQGREHQPGHDDWSHSAGGVGSSWDGGLKPQRMYAAGMAWSKPDEYEEDDDIGHHHKKQHVKEVDEECAHKWVNAMQNADGTAAPHFHPEQAETLRKAHCPDCKKWEWYVALNMMYADYCEVAKKVNANRDDFYVHMAKAFLMDEDAGPGKLMKYMEAIPKM